MNATSFVWEAKVSINHWQSRPHQHIYRFHIELHKQRVSFDELRENRIFYTFYSIAIVNHSIRIANYQCFQSFFFFSQSGWNQCVFNNIKLKNILDNLTYPTIMLIYRNNWAIITWFFYWNVIFMALFSSHKGHATIDVVGLSWT